MERAAAQIATGDYSHRVEVTSRDEVGRLAAEFNAMAAQLDETDRMRRDLVANVSHELRTPISALQAHLENIVDGVEAAPTPRCCGRCWARPSGSAAWCRSSSTCPAWSRAVLRCTTGASASARCSSRRPPRVGSTDPTSTSAVQVDGELEVDGDPERVHQVVANLLENAARYSPPGEPIDVFGRSAGGQVVIEVADHGPGIAADERTRVFERFYRADQSRAQDRGGAGLGLAIARWIVDLHGGEIRAERREPTGCRMVVSLPGGPVTPTGLEVNRSTGLAAPARREVGNG